MSKTRWTHIVFLAICFVVCSDVASVAEPPHDDLSLFLSKYGQPDVIISTENDSPRPPIVTKFIEYKKERVRAIYVPDSPVGAAPPYKNWKWFGFQDIKTKEVLRPREVVQRLQKREIRK